MRLPRFGIAWAMGFVAVVALNLFAIRALSEIDGKIGTLLGLGALPMANVLAVSALVAPSASWKPLLPRRVRDLRDDGVGLLRRLGELFLQSGGTYLPRAIGYLY